MADSGDCTVGVTVKVIGILEVPPDILTATATYPEDSEPLNCADVNSTTNSETKHNKYFMKSSLKFLLVESLITPTALFLLLSAVIAGPSDDGTFKVKSNCSCNSMILSVITGTLTLVIVFPLGNVVVSTAMLKSMSPDNQILLSTHYVIT